MSSASLESQTVKTDINQVFSSILVVLGGFKTSETNRAAPATILVCFL